MPIHAGYGLLVGAREAPGLARAGVAVLRRERDVVRRLGPSLAGQWRALQRARELGEVSELMISCAELRRGRVA